MKKALICFLLLFIVGCIPMQPIEEIKEEGPETIEKYVQGGVGFVKEIVANKYKITPGGSIVIEDTKLEITDINSESEVMIKVNDIEYTIYTTQQREIVDGLDLKATEIKFDPTGENTYVMLEATKFESNPNEYLMYINDKITIGDTMIILINIDTDTLNSINIKVDDIEKRINKGKTEVMSNLEITNMETNPRATAVEKYAIIKVLPIVL